MSIHEENHTTFEYEITSWRGKKTKWLGCSCGAPAVKVGEVEEDGS